MVKEVPTFRIAKIGWLRTHFTLEYLEDDKNLQPHNEGKGEKADVSSGWFVIGGRNYYIYYQLD